MNAPPPERRPTPDTGRLLRGLRRRAGRLLDPSVESTDVDDDADLADPSEPGAAPTAWSFRRRWARRELYTLALPQSRLDLAQSPLAPGGQLFRSVVVEGPEIVPTYADGSLVAEVPGPELAETHLRLFGAEPFATVQADLTVEGTQQAVAMIEWASDDGAGRLIVAAHGHTQTIDARLSLSGVVVASLPATAADLSGEFTLLAQLQGRSVLVWHRRGRNTTYVGRLELTPHLDLRAVATFSTWTLGLTVRGRDGAVITCRRFESALSGNGHADPRIVSYEDGTPLQDGPTVWFLATTRGAHIPDAFQGVYALDTSSGVVTMTGALFGERDGDGVRHNDNAGHLHLDRDTRRWTWFAIGHSDHPGRRRAWVGSSSTDLRHGVAHLPVEPVAMPDEPDLWEDVHPVRDGGRWVATASKNAKQTAWLESTAGIAGPWTETRVAVGDDETGQLLVRSGSRRFVVAGTRTSGFVVRDADDDALPALGHLDLDVATGGRRVWPVLFGLEEAGGTRWHLLSFDRTSPAEGYSYGRLHLYRQV